MDNKKWDLRFLELAKFISLWSKDPSTKLGAVIADGKRIVSYGYNGFPYNMPDIENNYKNRDEKYSRIIHSEINAVLNAREILTGFTIYTYPFIPCDRCFVQLLQVGIKRFVSPIHSGNERWDAAFNKTRTYAKEIHDIELIEMEF